MAPLPILCLILIVVVQSYQQVLGRQVVPPGGTFRQSCIFTIPNPNRDIIQFYIDKREVKMFNARTYNGDFRLVSNGTNIVPAITNYTNRYKVEEDNGIFTLVINDVKEWDSAWYGCFKYDLVWNEPKASQGSIELLVPGPFDGIFWTANFSGRLDLDKALQNELPDGAVVGTNNVWHGEHVACVMRASNMQPSVSITIGRYGQPGSVDITDDFLPMIESVTRGDNVRTSYRMTVFFVKRFKFRRSVPNLFCRAALLDKTYETSVNIQVTTKPTIGACEPINFKALLGSKNVNLTCLIEAHPEPHVEWILPNGGGRIDALSNNPNYTVTNEPRVIGVFTTLTISEVHEDDSAFGWVEINATNTEGSGGRYLQFTKAESAGAAYTAGTSTAFIIMTTLLLVWILR